MKRRCCRILALLSLAIMFSQVAFAETLSTPSEVANSKKMMSYIAANEYKILFDFGVQQDRKLGLQLGCKSNYDVKMVSIGLLQPIEFPDNAQHPAKGIWRLGYLLNRCGEAKRYNTIFAARDNGEPPTAKQFYPGASNAGPALIRDAMMAALARARIQGDFPDTCSSYDVADMVVTVPSHDVVQGTETYHRIWEETWSFNFCGRSSNVEMMFVPDKVGGGTSFHTKPLPSGVPLGR